MQITSKGQVTIPQAIRHAMGFLPHTQVAFEIDEAQQRVYLVKQNSHPHQRGQQLVAQLHGKANTHMKTDAIMQLTRDAA